MNEPKGIEPQRWLSELRGWKRYAVILIAIVIFGSSIIGFMFHIYNMLKPGVY